MCLAGCEDDKETNKTSELEIATENTVNSVQEESISDIKLSEIEKPVLGEIYMQIKGDNFNYDVLYGKGFPCYLDLNSGLPGFGYPLLIKGDSFCTSSQIVITTGYGEYTYSYVSSEPEDDSKSLINFGVKGEKVYLYSETDHIYYCYELKGGPTIGT